MSTSRCGGEFCRKAISNLFEIYCWRSRETLEHSLQIGKSDTTNLTSSSILICFVPSLEHHQAYRLLYFSTINAARFHGKVGTVVVIKSELVDYSFKIYPPQFKFQANDLVTRRCISLQLSVFLLFLRFMDLFITFQGSIIFLG